MPPSPLFPCPCCGFPTLSERSAWEICCVCWWEDDGQGDVSVMRFGEDRTGATRSPLRARIFSRMATCTTGEKESRSLSDPQ
ncbi:CPCC family cysteine-rich protein [Bradyrhizobium sp. AZCC 1721]|uniref:CPCC family cysteine-rich protein n=1 Tax=Bradyrhizobium sp. AZCC 1721 TaxID=3117016 RepID=UPI003FA5280F